MRITLAVVSLTLAGTCIAFSQDVPAVTPPEKPVVVTPHTPKVTKHQIKQQARINQGIKSGELTKGEARRLEAEQGVIQADKKIAKSDGKVTPAERRKLAREQKKASKDIYRLKHNDRKE